MAKKNKKNQNTKFKRFVIKLSGLLLILAALAVYASLATYNPADPAFNNLNDNLPLNALGGFGANLAEFVLFAFGVSLPIFLLGWLVWGYNLLRHNLIIEAKIRILAFVIGLVTTSTFLNLVCRYRFGKLLWTCDRFICWLHNYYLQCC